MTELTLDEALSELSSAEDFLNYFSIPYDPAVVQVNRLHIMQRFHDYLQQGRDLLEECSSNSAIGAVYTQLLTRAYQDFVTSDALTEKVFKVFKNQSGEAFVPVEQLLGH